MTVSVRFQVPYFGPPMRNRRNAFVRLSYSERAPIRSEATSRMLLVMWDMWYVEERSD